MSLLERKGTVEYSIIIPMRNAEDYIEQCLKSIIVQTYINFEIIIVDDASEDNSVKLARKVLNN